MGTYSIYFSPTGGTKKVMDILAGQWGKTETIDLSVPGKKFWNYCFQREDICLVGVPSYGGRVPDMALERLKKMEGGNARAVIVVAYGNRHYDDTVLELKNELEKTGFRVEAAIAAVTEHSILRQFGTGRPDDKDTEELKSYVDKIKSAWKNPEYKEGLLCVPGKTPYREYDGVPFKPKAGRKCTKCGVCASLCPVQAIPESSPETVDESKCISCMRCVSVCPEHARGVGKMPLFFAGRKLKSACEKPKENELFLGMEEE